MTKVVFTKIFRKNFKKRISSDNLNNKFKQRLELFMIDPQNRVLKDHKLKGSMSEYRSFWIAGDIRVIYEIIEKNKVKFIDIGSHNQVY